MDTEYDDIFDKGLKTDLEALESDLVYVVLNEAHYRRLADRLNLLRSLDNHPFDEIWLPEDAHDPVGRKRCLLKLNIESLHELFSPSSEANTITAPGGETRPPADGREAGGRGFAVRASTPSAEGLHMPAEWEPHAGCWMAWPCRESLWNKGLDRARHAFAGLARAISQFEPVTMLARPEHTLHASKLCGPQVSVWALDIDDSWARDTGPSFVIGTEGVAGVDWTFNGYGNVFTDHMRDNTMARAILEKINAQRYVAPLVMEGGSFHIDGEGTLLTTEECLLNPNRNPDLNRSRIETLLKEYLNVATIIWLGQGLEDDESIGHVSNIACFTRPGQVVVQTSRDPADNFYWIAQENIARLRAALDAWGRRLEIIEIQQPEPRLDPKGRRLPLSYINFYLANGAVIMPSFDDPADTPAKLTIERLFPDRQIIQIPALEIVRGGGGIHCATQQQPMGIPKCPV